MFGKEGMLKLWSASNAFLYLGSVKENDFLQHVSELVGDYDRETTSASYNKGVCSTSTASKRERILTVDELGAMPRGRAVMLSTGSRAALLRTVPWYEGTKEKVEAIKASIAAHDPATTPVRGAERASVATTSARPVAPGAEPVVASVEPAPAIDLAVSMRALMENEDAKRTEAQRD
ncbi:TraM recognition domain-containing protein [Rathayibacter sp. VKM Ac-2760]|nr:TraM recognition domain-containing protein [Rathayibacter sp. VKM Ac-2760]